MVSLQSSLRGAEVLLFDVYGTLAHISRPARPFLKLCRLASASSMTSSNIAMLMSNRLSLVEAADALGISVSARQMDSLEHELQEELERVQLYPEVVDVLEALRDKGVRLALCSNVAHPYVAPAWALLAPLVDAAIWSCEVGFVKPQPEIYRLALEKFRAPCHAAVMIGDSYRHDVLGPRQAGIRALQLDRRGTRLSKAVVGPNLTAILEIGRDE